MHAIEFDADIRDGLVKIPEHYKPLQDQPAHVVILFGTDRDDAELRARSDHSAGLVQEWQETDEDDVWT